jgi:hypothetical protein
MSIIDTCGPAREQDHIPEMEGLMRTDCTPIIPSLALVLLGALTLGGCSLSASMGTSGTAATATATPKPTHAPIQPGDTSLCNTVSTAEFGQAIGGTITTLVPSAKKDPASNQESVACLYLNQQQPGVGGAIFYLVVTDGPAWYATAKQSATQSNTGVTDLSGLGDAAFSSMPTGSPPRTVLAVLEGNLFFNILVYGAPDIGLPPAKRIAQLILSRV